MKKEESEGLGPGRYMDRLVAENVFGWSSFLCVPVWRGKGARRAYLS